MTSTSGEKLRGNSSNSEFGLRVQQLAAMPAMKKYIGSEDSVRDIQRRIDNRFRRRQSANSDSESANSSIGEEPPTPPPASVSTSGGRAGRLQLPTFAEYRQLLLQSQSPLPRSVSDAVSLAASAGTSASLSGTAAAHVRRARRRSTDAERAGAVGGVGDGGGGAAVAAAAAAGDGERRRAAGELQETEENFGRDLRLLRSEFEQPLLQAQLLSEEECRLIFLNVTELLAEHESLLKRISTGSGCSDSEWVGRIADTFVGNERLLMAFQRYCRAHRRSLSLLEQLERERKLLRVFLGVCQDENPRLRRMPLRSFLILPVQRVTRYPLLLARLLRATPPAEAALAERLRCAKVEVEEAVRHINDCGSARRRSCSCSNAEMVQAAADSLHWPIVDCRFCGTVQYTVVTDCTSLNSSLNSSTSSSSSSLTLSLSSSTLSASGDSLKWSSGWAVVLARNCPTLKDASSSGGLERELFPENLDRSSSSSSCEPEVAVLLFRDRGAGRRAPLREPFLLSSCVVCASFADNCVELSDIRHATAAAAAAAAAGSGSGNTSSSTAPAVRIRSQSPLLLQLLLALGLRCGRWRLRRGAVHHVFFNFSTEDAAAASAASAQLASSQRSAAAAGEV